MTSHEELLVSIGDIAADIAEETSHCARPLHGATRFCFQEFGSGNDMLHLSGTPYIIKLFSVGSIISGNLENRFEFFVPQMVPISERAAFVARDSQRDKCTTSSNRFKLYDSFKNPKNI
jgi:hypothetical protein